mgnify:CR=1 FL=1
MKQLFALSILLTLFSCSSDLDKKIEKTVKNAERQDSLKNGAYEHTEAGVFWGSMDYKIEERIIDSCEYIIIFGTEGRNIIHKANCNNSFHLSHPN